MPFAFLLFTSAVSAQRLAILTPEKAEASVAFAEKLETSFSDKIRLIDDSLAETAYKSVSPETPFNLTIDESKRIGSVIGCDFFVVLRSANQRRSAFKRAEYYESYAVIYLVSSRSGRLVLWKLPSFEAPKADKASALLDTSVADLAAELETAMRAATQKELAEPDPPAIGTLPEAGTPDSKDFRAPIPYKRIKPEYTTQAGLYDVAATVDMMVDTDASGKIIRTEIVRWAGFGLDESVMKTVLTMNWRPAERNGKPLPMRFLVRYNFKKVP